MKTKEMKLLALRRALDKEASAGGNPDGLGYTEVLSLSGIFKLACCVFQLTQFSFLMLEKRNGYFSCCGEISEECANNFLRELQ